jgi:hypothetical protein
MKNYRYITLLHFQHCCPRAKYKDVKVYGGVAAKLHALTSALDEGFTPLMFLLLESLHYSTNRTLWIKEK